MKRVIRANKLQSGKGFSYILKHGLGPGTLPKDVEIIDHTEDGYKDIIWLNRRLNADELKYYDIKPYGVAINVMEARKDYGGAYDIDPYSYFTKDDLMEVAYELVDKIGETTGVRTDVSDVYTRGDDTIVIELDCNGSVSRQSFKYDLRRIRKPSDIKKYITPTFMFKFIEDFHNIGEIEDDVYERLEREIWK